MSGANRLYTPQLLSVTLELANYPLDRKFALTGTARSRSCGSVISIGLDVDDAGAICAIGMRVSACAVGQAAAAIFAASAIGRNQRKIAAARQQLQDWLSEDGQQPDWPRIELLDAARAYTGRHGAITLGWDAANKSLSAAFAQN